MRVVSPASCFPKLLSSRFTGSLPTFDHISDVALQVSDPGGARWLLSSSRCFHPKVWTGTLSRWPGLLRSGKWHHCRHLLQGIHGQDLLQHRHGHPQTFWGSHYAAYLRCGIFCSENAVFKIQAAHLATQQTASCHRVTRTACGDLYTGQLDESSSCCSAAHIRRMQTSPDIWRDGAGSWEQRTIRVFNGTSYMTVMSGG